jgi:hypothetical protein
MLRGVNKAFHAHDGWVILVRAPVLGVFTPKYLLDVHFVRVLDTTCTRVHPPNVYQLQTTYTLRSDQIHQHAWSNHP